MSKRRAYLAGPEVFLPDAIDVAQAKKQLCLAYGIEGVFPLDADVPLGGLSLRDQAMRISSANEALITSCHLVIANITPFRGPSADVGTAYEMGFARGLGLPVFAYTNASARFAERVAATTPGGARRRADGVLADERAMSIEPFGLHENLMLEGAVAASGTQIAAHDAGEARLFTDLTAFEECVRRARAALRA